MLHSGSATSTVQYQICSTNFFPFDLPTQSVTYKFILILLYIKNIG